MRHAGGEARIEFRARRENAEAVRADQPHAAGARGMLARLRERARAVSETRGDDDAGRHPLAPGVCHDRGDALRRCRNDDQIGWPRQVVESADRTDALDLVIVRIDEPDLAHEAGLAQVAQNRAPGRGAARACTNERDRLRREQSLEAVGRHREGGSGSQRWLCGRTTIVAETDPSASAAPLGGHAVAAVEGTCLALTQVFELASAAAIPFDQNSCRSLMRIKTERDRAR